MRGWLSGHGQGSIIDLELGYSHPIEHPIPEGVAITVADNVKIHVEGPDKQKVGQVAAEIKSYYPVEPYKGKGVRILGQYRPPQGRKEISLSKFKMKLSKKKELTQKRRWRIRKKINGTAERPRVCVRFSNKNIHAQCIDDEKAHTVVGIATTHSDFKKSFRMLPELRNWVPYSDPRSKKSVFLQSCSTDRKKVSRMR